MKDIYRTYQRATALGCTMALLMGCVIVPTEYQAQGKTKKPVLSAKKLTVQVGKSKALKVKRATGAKVTWKIKNTKIAGYKKSGKYTARIIGKKAGSTTVTAKIRKGGKTTVRTCKIAVTKQATQKTNTSNQTPGQTPGGSTSANGDNIPGVKPGESPETTASVTPTTKPGESPEATASGTPTTKPSESPKVTASATPTVKPSPTPVVTPTPTVTPVISENVLAGSTVKKQSESAAASVSGDTAIVTFTNATLHQQADFTLASSISLANVTKVYYELEVSGTPDSACFKLYDSSGTELSKVTQYNKKTGSYTITIPGELKEKTVAGFAVMTNSDIADTTQTATVTVKSLKFEYSGKVEVPESPEPEELSPITLSADTFLGSGAVSGNPVYNSDGSVTFTATQQYSGGGVGFCLDTTKTAKDMSDYTKVIFTVSTDAEAPITLNYFTSSEYWGGRKDLTYSTGSTTAKEIGCAIPQGAAICGFGVKFNTNGADLSTLPTQLEITIHSITLVKDKRDITVATTEYSKMSELASAYGFKLGTVMSDSTVADSKYSGLMKYHFNSITAANEMKAYSMLDESASKSAYTDENSMPVLNFTKADDIAEFAQENGIGLRGHTLVWDAGMKDWFFRVGYDTSKDYASKEVIQARLKNYIKQVITHFETEYPGVIYCWDVVNEAVGDNSDDYAAEDERHVRTMRGGKKNIFYETLGSDYVELSFRYTYEVIEELRTTLPDIDLKLYYNDYNTFYAEKRDAICELVKSINSYLSDGKGGYVKLCDGVGMQSYIGGFGSQNGCMNDGDITKVKEAIQKFAGFGVEVQVTELAVRNYKNSDEVLTKHAEFYKKLFRVYMDVNSGTEKPLKAVSIWGIVDNPDLDPEDYSYTMNGTYCGLFNEKLGVKPSFISVYNLLKDGE